LAELKKSERYTGQLHPKFKDLQIMVGSILSIHVVDARDILPANNYTSANCYLKLSLDGQTSKTLSVANNNDPVWDEVIIFDIRTGREKLLVQLYDVQGGFVSSNNLVGSCEISLESLSEQQQSTLDRTNNQDSAAIDQMKQDRLYDMKNGKTKVRLAIQWIYSRVKLLEDILNLLRTQKLSDE